MYFKATSLLPKIDNLKILSSVYSPDIICVVETWLDTDILESKIAIQGYTVIRLDRNRHGGGIIYVAGYEKRDLIAHFPNLHIQTFISLEPQQL